MNNRRKNFTRVKMKRRLQQIEKSLDRYFMQLDRADREEGPAGEVKSAGISEKITALKEKMRQMQALEAEMLASADQQLSQTDPDARSMMTTVHGSGMVGYNVQSAVETEHHLIVEHEVTNTGSDLD